MSILLDTHYVIWFATRPELVTSIERQLIERCQQEIAVSVVAFWEIRVKWEALDRRGKGEGGCTIAEAMSFVEESGFSVEPLTIEAVVEKLTLEIDHPDPFDRMLLTHAQQLGARLLTRDRALTGHPIALVA